MDEFNKNEIEDLEKRVQKLLEPLPSHATSTLAEAPKTNKKSSKSQDLMKKLLNEAETNYKEDKDETDGWCCICNDDGNFKCIDCDDDVYCKRCFK
jgi:hypothetical protein